VRRLAVVMALAASTAAAQQIVVPASLSRAAVQATKDGLVLPAGEFTVAELIDAVSTFLCRNYLFDGTEILHAQGFSLQRPIALDALGSEEMLYALLSTRDFAVLPLDEQRGIYQIVSLDPGQRRNDVLVSTPWRSNEEILRRPHLREIVVTAVDLERADAVTLANTLRGACAALGPWRPGGLIASASDRRWLMLHGYREVVAQAITFARQFDRLCPPPVQDPLLLRVQQLEREVAELKSLLGRAGLPAERR
jgi:hypothetical protein